MENKASNGKAAIAIPHGYCQCGCGRKTWVSTINYRKGGYVRGRPVRYCGGHNSRKYAHDTAEKVCDLYSSGLSRERVAETLGISVGLVQHYMGKAGIQARPKWNASRRYEFDESCFDKLTPSSEYWLGFLIADAWTTASRCAYSLGVTLSAIDAAHLEKLRSFLKTDSPVRYFWKRSPKSNEMVRMATLRIHSKHLVNRIVQWGITPAKSLTAVVNSKQLAMSPDFWRGAIDGDGGIYIEDARPYAKPVKMQLTGSKFLTRQFSEFVKFVCPTCHANITKSPESNAWIFSISKGFAVPIIRCLYFQSTVSLDRKQATAEEVLGMGVAEGTKRYFKNVYAPDGMAHCGKCKQYLPLDAFHRNKSKHHGRDNTCKACTSIRKAEYNKRNSVASKNRISLEYSK